MNKLLDHGYVEFLDMFGDELTIVNAARVSYGTTKEALDDKDIKLIKYLKDHMHHSPFRHIMFRFKLKAPEAVMRQLYKHIVGIEMTSSDASQLHGWNEISGRYKPVQDYHIPAEWRAQSASSKQASDGLISENRQEEAKKLYENAMIGMIGAYEGLLALGVAKEQARMILPLSMYTEVMWTCSFQALANFIKLRDEPTAQWEIMIYAKVLKSILEEKCPVLTKIWFNGEN